MELDSTTVKRLSFIKYLYQIGINQSKNSEHIAGAALLTFHDSAELFLKLSSEELNIGKSGLHFMEYWELISNELSGDKELTQKESMRRLNKARVALKHHGTQPSKIDLEAFRATITNFFQENCTLIFGIDFPSISMIDFIEPESARVKLKEAENFKSNEQIDEALDQIIIAFNVMLKDYENRKRGKFSKSPFFFGKDLNFYNSFFMGLNDDRGNNKMAEFVDRVKESIESMQEAIKILALGIDYKKFSKFKLLTPHIEETMNGEYIISRNSYVPREKSSKKEVQFCIDFVVEAALQLQEFDYDVEENINSAP